MHAHKLKVTVPEDHRVELRLPDDFPEGPAEVIILTPRASKSGDRVSPGTSTPDQKRALAALVELRTVPLSAEEEEVLDQLESFRQDYPIRFSCLIDED